MTNQEYNGWTNYETWNVKLWIDNEQPVAERWAAVARSLKGQPNAAYDLTQALLDDYNDQMDEINVTGTFHDLLGAALRVVNWREIAQHLLDDVEG